MVHGTAIPRPGTESFSASLSYRALSHSVIPFDLTAFHVIKGCTWLGASRHVATNALPRLLTSRSVPTSASDLWPLPSTPKGASLVARIRPGRYVPLDCPPTTRLIDVSFRSLLSSLAHSHRPVVRYEPELGLRRLVCLLWQG